MQGGHALLTDRIEARQRGLGASDGVVVQMRDQSVRSLPGLFIGFAHDDMQANAEAHGTTELGGLGPDLLDFLCHRRRWFAPGQNHFHLLCREVLRRFRRATKVQRRTRLLDRRIEQFRALHADVLAVVVHRLALQHSTPDPGEFHRRLIALLMTEEQAITGQFFRVAPRHQVEQRPATGQPIQGRGLTRRHRRGNDPGT
ncbi:hypothetical protein D3C78_1259810 [compost metagenome]